MSGKGSIEEMRKRARFSELHIAILEVNIREIKNILKSDSCKEQLQFRDVSGSTPLMTAVIVGRHDIVRLLLNKRASTRTKDSRGHTALDHTRPTYFVKHKLNIYAAMGFRLSKPNEREKRRISETLRYPAALWSCRHIGTHPLSHSVIFKHGAKLEVLNAMGRMKPSVFTPAKKDADLIAATSGFITSQAVKNPVVIQQAAISGWVPNQGRGPKVLDNEKYTQMVRDVARLWGFKLQKSMRDNGGFEPLPEHRGRFAACHIEKKLTVWWVEKVMDQVLGTKSLRRLSDLRNASLPRDLSEAKLFLDHRPCHDCWKFLFKIYKITGIRIRVETIKFVVEGTRVKVPNGCANCTCDSCLRKQETDQPIPRGPVPRSEPLDVDDDVDGELSDGEPQMVAPLHPSFAASLPGMITQTAQRDAQGELVITKAPRHWTSFSSAPTDKRPCAKPLLKPAPRNIVIHPSSQLSDDQEAAAAAAVSTINGRSAYFEASSSSQSSVRSPSPAAPGSGNNRHRPHAAASSTRAPRESHYLSIPNEDVWNFNTAPLPVPSPSPSLPAARTSRASSVFSVIQGAVRGTLNLGRFMFAGSTNSVGNAAAQGSVLSERLKKGRSKVGSGLSFHVHDNGNEKTNSQINGKRITSSTGKSANMSNSKPSRTSNDIKERKVAPNATVLRNQQKTAVNNMPKGRAAARVRREEKLRCRSVFARAYHGQQDFGGGM
ncbi:hypothetical protein QBC44DRAFT_93195 [Cladorrhinum sp. PSN332]|nr:hypothetical protein QBC44DRAFT_93195 [Cladorrhinum sp. PSN332]